MIDNVIRTANPLGCENRSFSSLGEKIIISPDRIKYF